MGNSTPCTICGGQPDEHQGRVHAYSSTEGDLATPEQMQKRDKPQQGLPPGIGMMVAPRSPHDGTAVGRLVEVLVEKNLLSTPEALYIAGMGPKPEPKKYAEPFRINIQDC